MNNYEDWAQLVAKKLKGEADLIAAIEKEELDDAAATEVFVRAVLEPFLPENFGIGNGRVVDAFGNYSEPLDIVVYNRDFPRIGMRVTNNAYLYESVLAAFSVRAKFIRKTFFDAMNACASLAELKANIDKTVLVRLAKKNGLTLGPNKKFVHRDPLHTARFDLIGRPPAFVFGFSGIKNSYRQLQENIELWIEHRQKEELETDMKSLPAVIATQGCFAWRNAAPLALSNREMLGIGNDDAPIRLIVLQLLYLLNRRLHVTADGYGLKPNLKAYLSQFSPPRFEVGAGAITADGVVASRGDEQAFAQPTHSSLYVAAKDRAPQSAQALKPTQPAAQPAQPAQPAAQPAQPAAQPAPPQQATAPETAERPAPGASAAQPPSPAPSAAQPASEPAVQASFDKPSPFASAPKPPAEETAESGQAYRAPMSAPLGSAPIPMESSNAEMPVPEFIDDPAPGEAEAETATTPTTAPLGAAPIPTAGSPATSDETRQSADAGAASSKPPQDAPPQQPAEAATESDDGEDDFIDTMVIPPDASASRKEPARNSTDAFIARVKQQLAASESNKEGKAEAEDQFTSTIPQ